MASLVQAPKSCRELKNTGAGGRELTNLLLKKKRFSNRGIVQERQSLQCKWLEESIEFAAAMRVGGGTSGSIIVVTPPPIVHREQRLARARKFCANGLAEE